MWGCIGDIKLDLLLGQIPLRGCLGETKLTLIICHNPLWVPNVLSRTPASRTLPAMVAIVRHS